MGRGIQHFGITKADKEVLGRFGNEWRHGGKLSKRAVLLARAGYLQRLGFSFRLTAKGHSALTGKDVECGGQGSGCHGPNCGRPHISVTKSGVAVRVALRHEGKEKGHVMAYDDGKYYHVKDADLDRELRGQGFGKAMYSKIISLAKREGKQYVYSDEITSTKAAKVWKSLGAVRDGMNWRVDLHASTLGAPLLKEGLGKPKRPLTTPTGSGHKVPSPSMGNTKTGPGMRRPNVALKTPKVAKPITHIERYHPIGTGHSVGKMMKRPHLARPNAPVVGLEADVEGEPTTGVYQQSSIDPVVWFHPPSLTKREDNETTRVPTDDPRETNDKYLDVTKRNSPDTEEFRLKLLKKQAPPGGTTNIPAHTTLISPHTAVYQPSMLDAAAKVPLRQRPVRTGKRSFTSYDRRGCI